MGRILRRQGLYHWHGNTFETPLPFTAQGCRSAPHQLPLIAAECSLMQVPHIAWILAYQIFGGEKLNLYIFPDFSVGFYLIKNITRYYSKSCHSFIKNEYFLSGDVPKWLKGPHSKCGRSVDDPSPKTLDISGFSGLSTLFNNWISTVFLRFVLRFLHSALSRTETRKALKIQRGDVSKWS